MLETRAVMTLCLGNGFAQLPHGLRLCQRGGERGIAHDAALGGLLERRAERVGEPRSRIGRGQLDEHVPGGVLVQRIGDPRNMLDRERDRDARHELEGGERLAGGAPQMLQQLERARRRIDSDERGGAVARLGKELQTSSRDHAERALGADEQRLDVVARVVLAQALESRQHASVREHDLEAEHQVAHHAVAQDRGAARVGREVSADLRRPFRAQAQRE